MTASRAWRSTVIAHLDVRAAIQRIGECAVAKHAENSADRLLGVVLDVPHIGLDHRKTIMGDHFPQLVRAGFVGGDLGGEIGQILLDVAAGIGAGGQQGAGLCFPKPAATHQQEIVDQNALFLDMVAIGWR